MGFRTAQPAPNTGYNRTTDWPTTGGARTANGGPGMSFLKSSVAAPSGSNTWHPTVAWLMGFVVVELVAFRLLSRFLNL